MDHSSETIGAIAAALAKAQIELTNPEKSLTGTISSESPREDGRTFRYAPLSSGLAVVRKCLGKYEIAAVQTTSIDKEAGLIRLTTTLAHASGEWLSSEWPVCAVSETLVPQRLGAALTYARRHALFTLVGIAGDDDTDAPGVQRTSSQNDSGGNGARPSWRKPRPVSAGKPAMLAEVDSAARRDELLNQLAALASEEELAIWAKETIPFKNTLIEGDARVVEDTFAERATALAAGNSQNASTVRRQPISADAQSARPNTKQASSRRTRATAVGEGIDKSVLAFPEPRRIRDKTHLRFVAGQPCLVCGRTPSDAHHIRFAQLRALGRKVSDEFTVPLCRGHHRELHQRGDEVAFWKSLTLDPLEIAHQLWTQTRRGPSGQT